MSKILRLIISLLMAFSLWGCTPKSAVEVDLSSVVFTGLFIGTAQDMTAEKTLTIASGESEILRPGLQIDQWTKVEKEDQKIPEAWFILLDQDGLTYHFSQYGPKLQIAITKKNYAPVFYEVPLKINEVISGILKTVTDSTHLKTALHSAYYNIGFTDLGPTWTFGSFPMDQTMSDSAIALLDLDAWILTSTVIQSIDLTQNEFSLAMNDKIILYFHATESEAFVTVFQSNKYLVYSITLDIYDAVRTFLMTTRAQVMPAPGALVKEAVYTQVTLESQEWTPIGLLPVTLTLTQTQSDLAKPYLMIDQWVKLSTAYDLSVMEKHLTLKDKQGITTTIGMIDGLPLAILTKDSDAQFKEIYGLPNNLKLILWAFSDGFDEAKPNSAMLAMSPTTVMILTGYDTLGNPTYQTSTIDSSKLTQLKNSLNVTSWRMDLNNLGYHFGWNAEFEFTDHAGNHFVICGGCVPHATLIWVRGPMAKGNEDLFYIAPSSLLDDLKNIVPNVIKP